MTPTESKKRGTWIIAFRARFALPSVLAIVQPFAQPFTLAIVLAILLAGCDDAGIFGTENANLPPTTRMTVDQVNLQEGTLLSSRIELSWWGSDPDGYVIGYEIAIGDTTQTDWAFTKSTDSLFTLPIRAGLSSDTVVVRVRAVDDDSLRDPIGASIQLPVKNTNPVIRFSAAQTPPDTTFGVVSFGWNVSDQDGLEGLNRVEIAFNDPSSADAWTSLPLPDPNGDGEMFITLLVDFAAPSDPDSEGRNTARATILLGSSLSTPSEPITAAQLLPEAANRAFIRAIDNSGASSNLDSLTWFLKRQNSRVLFLNDDDSPQAFQKQAFHVNRLAANGITPDILSTRDGSTAGGTKVKISQALPRNPATRSRMLSQWDHIYWISNSLDRNITYAQSMLDEFLEQGGTMFAAIPSKNLPISDDLFQFLPIGQIAAPQGIQNSFRILANSEITGTDLQQQGVDGELVTLPALKVQTTLLSVFPMEAVAGATVLYTADFKAQWITGQVVDYNEFEDVVIRSGEGNLIYAALDLTLLDAAGTVEDFIGAVCVDLLGFTQ